MDLKRIKDYKTNPNIIVIGWRIIDDTWCFPVGEQFKCRLSEYFKPNRKGVLICHNPKFHNGHPFTYNLTCGKCYSIIPKDIYEYVKILHFMEMMRAKL